MWFELLGVLSTYYSLLWLRLLPAKFCSIHFAITLILGLLWLASVCIVPFVLNKIGLISKYRMSRVSLQLAGIMMRSVIFFNPQVRIVRDYSRYTWNSVSANANVFVNHTSFFDSFLYTSEVPLSIVGFKRTLMKSSLANFPIAGWLFFSPMQNFPVYFSSEKQGEFGVDREKQEKVTRDMDQFFASGGSCTYCPEGSVNVDPDTIQPLRFGMLKKLVETGHPIAIFTHYNNHLMWPKSAQFGGYPTDVGVSLADYKYKGGKESMPRKKEDGEVDIALVAEDMRNFMQCEYDRLKTEMNKKI